MDQELNILFIQCFEVKMICNISNCLIWVFCQNAIEKKHSGLSLECAVEAIVNGKLLTSSTNTLIQSHGYSEPTVVLDVLESVAMIRYCLRVVANLLQLHSKHQECNKLMYNPMVHRLLEESRYHHFQFFFKCVSHLPLGAGVYVLRV